LNTLVPINGESTRIVGVMPEGFGFPSAQDIWLPLEVASVVPATGPRNASVLVFGRLAPGATHALASAEATTALRRALDARATTGQPASAAEVRVESFPAAQIGDERTIVFTSLNVAAGLILLLALVNVTTLLSARAGERARELALRLALGASPLRLFVQGMWEGVILCVAGGALGVAGAAWALDTITRWTQLNLQGNMVFWWVWRLDRVTLLSAGAFVTIAVAVLSSVVWQSAVRTNVREVIQDGSARSGSRREGKVTRGLVMLQVATVTVLMYVGVLSGVMAYRVVRVDPGYDATNLLQASLEPSDERFPAGDARAQVFRTVEERLAGQGAIDAVLLRARLARQHDYRGTFALRQHDAFSALPSANILATLGSMSTLGVELVEGRLFEPTDDRTRAPVVLISRSLAARHWRGRSPVGDQLRLAAVGDSTQWRTVAGVVSDIPYGDALSRDRSTDAIYVPLLQSDAADASVIVRHTSSELAGRQALSEVFTGVDPFLVPGSVYQAAEVIRKSGLIATGLVKLFGGCFAFALLLAVAGTYGLLSRSMGQRTREVGVRRALGGSDPQITRMLLLQGARQLGVGAVAAAPVLLIVGTASTRLLPLSGLLTATAAVLVSAAIVAVVAAATWLPVRRVLRLTPRAALGWD
jgi:putative ABC transport system permease protein